MEKNLKAQIRQKSSQGEKYQKILWLDVSMTYTKTTMDISQCSAELKQIKLFIKKESH
jgi:hypothetical protein